MKRILNKAILPIALLFALHLSTHADYYDGRYYGPQKNSDGQYRSLTDYFGSEFEAQSLRFTRNVMRLKETHRWFYLNAEESLGLSLSDLKEAVTYFEACLKILIHTIDILTQGDATFIHEAMEDTVYPVVSRSGLYGLMNDLQVFTDNSIYQEAIQGVEDPIPSTISLTETCFPVDDSYGCFNIYDEDKIPFSRLPYSYPPNGS